MSRLPFRFWWYYNGARCCVVWWVRVSKIRRFQYSSHQRQADYTIHYVCVSFSYQVLLLITQSRSSSIPTLLRTTWSTPFAKPFNGSPSQEDRLFPLHSNDCDVLPSHHGPWAPQPNLCWWHCQCFGHQDVCWWFQLPEHSTNYPGEWYFRIQNENWLQKCALTGRGYHGGWCWFPCCSRCRYRDDCWVYLEGIHYLLCWVHVCRHVCTAFWREIEIPEICGLFLFLLSAAWFWHYQLTRHITWIREWLLSLVCSVHQDSFVLWGKSFGYIYFHP